VRDHKAALIAAAAAGDESEARALLDDGAAANCADYDKRTVHTELLEERKRDLGGKFKLRAAPSLGSSS
jgi:hypothetical protein